MDLSAFLWLVLAAASAPATPTRAEALRLYKVGDVEGAADTMAEVFRGSTDPNERRAAAMFTARAYIKAWESGPRPDKADLLCRGLAVADDFLNAGPSPAMSKERGHLLAYREPFEPCEAPESSVQQLALMPVVARRTTPRTAVAVEAVAVEAVAVEAPKRPVNVVQPPHRRPLVWGGTAATLLGAAGVGLGLGVGLAHAAGAADAADNLTAAASRDGRPFTAGELADLGRWRGDLQAGLAGAGVGAGVGAALIVAGVALIAVGVKKERAGDRRRSSVSPGIRGVSLRFQF
jgi:hypothetical protein